MVCRSSTSQGKSVYLVGSISARAKSIASLLSKRLGSYRCGDRLHAFPCAAGSEFGIYIFICRFLDVIETIAAATGKSSCISAIHLRQELVSASFV